MIPIVRIAVTAFGRFTAASSVQDLFAIGHEFVLKHIESFSSLKLWIMN